MSQTNLPFGMLFEKQAPPPPKFIVVPEYDVRESLSLIIDYNGKRIPYIQEQWASVETQTETFVRAETTDSDYEQVHIGTETATKVRAESADDDKPSLVLGTETQTRVKPETTDSDQEYNLVFMGTQTLSEVRTENTDAD